MKIKYLTILIAFFFFSNCGTAQKEGKTNTSQVNLPDGGILPLGNSPFEQDFVAKFKLSPLPFKADSKYEIKDTIPAENVIANIFESAEKAGSAIFGDYWGDEKIKEETRKGLEGRFINVDKSIFMVLNFGYVTRLPLNPNYYSLVFKIIPNFMEGTYTYTYLANYTKDGKFIDAIQVGGVAGYVDMESSWASEIKADDIKVNTKTVKRGGMEDGSKDFTEYAYLTYQVEENGKFQMHQEKYTGFSGDFKNADNQEVVHVEEFPDNLQISYQSQQAQTELEIVKFDKAKNTIIAKFPESGKQLTLVYDTDKKGFMCANLGDKKREFIRAKN